MNAFRQLLKAAGSHPPVGTWIMSASPIVAEAVGHAGFDWGVVDMEHAPLDIMGLVHMLQALSATKMVPVVRVPGNDAVTVKRVLDAGAATRYPPQGIRGTAGMSRASRFGTVPNYLKTANSTVGVIVQLETPQAIGRLEEIAGVDGVDAVFIGPSDLSANMGHLGQPMHPAVLDLMAQAARRCKALGKPVGTLGFAPEAVAQYRAAGFDYLAVASDLGLLMRGAQAVVTALRTPDSEHVHSLATGTQLQAGY